MNAAQATEIMRSGILVAVKLCAPLLILSMGVGVLISIIQAATQIHEQTITFVPKLLLTAVVLLILGPWMLNVLQDYLRELFLIMQQG